MRRARNVRLKQLVRAHLRRMRGGLALAALSMLAFTATELLRPWPLKIIFDHILLGKPPTGVLAVLEPALQDAKILSLVALCSAVVLLAVLKGACAYLQVFVTSRIGYELVHALRQELFGHLQRLSLSFHARARSGELLTKVTGDTNALKDLFAESALTFTTQVLVLVGMVGIMLFVDWQLTLVALVTLPILYQALRVLHRRIRASVKRQRKQEGRIVSRLSERLTALSLVQAFGRERDEMERFRAESSETVEEHIRTARIEAAMSRVVELVSAVGTGSVVLLGSLLVLEGRMTPGEVLVFASYMGSMYKPIRHVAQLAAKFSKAAVSFERVAEILDTQPDIQDEPGATDAPAFAGAIAFADVSFDYGDGRALLSEVSFVIPAGRRVALVGASGAGKSTIVSLMLRLYDPRQGVVSIDGTDIRRYRLESLRRQIGVVLQDSLLFGATIRENIAYGKPRATTEEIEAAARSANAHEFIGALPDGYETVVGERGQTLSGGQRRRIAIARALVRAAPILILDEPMAGLDPASEAKVRDALRRLMAGRTCLVITHDLHEDAGFDAVLELDDGRITERAWPAPAARVAGGAGERPALAAVASGAPRR